MPDILRAYLEKIQKDKGQPPVFKSLVALISSHRKSNIRRSIENACCISTHLTKVLKASESNLHAIPEGSGSVLSRRERAFSLTHTRYAHTRPHSRRGIRGEIKCKTSLTPIITQQPFQGVTPSRPRIPYQCKFWRRPLSYA